MLKNHSLTLEKNRQEERDLLVEKERAIKAKLPYKADIFLPTDVIPLEERVRGRGLGRKATLAFEQHAQELGAERVTLNVWGGNEVARSLYRSLGYVEESVHMGKRLV